MSAYEKQNRVKNKKKKTKRTKSETKKYHTTESDRRAMPQFYAPQIHDKWFYEQRTKTATTANSRMSHDDRRKIKIHIPV